MVAVRLSSVRDLAGGLFAGRSLVERLQVLVVFVEHRATSAGQDRPARAKPQAERVKSVKSVRSIKSVKRAGGRARSIAALVENQPPSGCEPQSFPTGL
jgi:hypothetical protein